MSWFRSNDEKVNNCRRLTLRRETWERYAFAFSLLTYEARQVRENNASEADSSRKGGNTVGSWADVFSKVILLQSERQQETAREIEKIVVTVPVLAPADGSQKSQHTAKEIARAP